MDAAALAIPYPATHVPYTQHHDLYATYTVDFKSCLSVGYSCPASSFFMFLVQGELRLM